MNIRNISKEKLGMYACADANACWRLYEKYIDIFKRDEYQKMYDLFENIEMPTLEVLYEMERAGVQVDKAHLKDFSERLEARIKKEQQAIFDLAGHSFNVNSPKQLGEVLFDEMGLTVIKKTKSGNYSTNERVLKDLQEESEIIEHILNYRELTKIKSTYADALQDKVQKDGRIHANLNQAVTSTGRLSSSNPNLQNIPIASDLGTEIREAFTANEGRLLLALDIAQQELRVAAILSKEDHLIDTFKKGNDVHKLTASKIFDKDIEEINSDERRVGKTLNFAILYGVSAYGLSDRLKIDNKKAQDMIDKFWDGYPKLKNYFDAYLEKGKENGYVETLFGRRRSANNLNSSNFRVRNAAKREIINFPIQGTSAELMKKSMIMVQDMINSQDLELNPRPILQIHDEIVVEIDEGSDEQIINIAKKLKKTMESGIDFEIPLKVDAKKGKTWATYKDINF
jgi:DNA polymerase-1